MSETTRPGALIFGMLHHLVDLYQVCSNVPLGPKMAPPQGSRVLHRLNYEAVQGEGGGSVLPSSLKIMH